MLEFLNQYSILWIALAFVLLYVLVTYRNKPKPRDYIALGVVLVGLWLAWNSLHPRSTPLMDNAKMVQEMVGQGTPVLLEFQSPY
ncbi:MAG: hypothetical protein QGM50_07770 [Anaerolineae bacterium]|nr:hypothetical protein [Anaerolineae bacterium]MDK1118671.1 hypothetical protein [Anaerolineae bacterium]